MALPASAQRLVAVVSLSPAGATRRAVVAVLWPDVAERQAHGALRSTLWRIRRTVPNLIRTDAERLAIAPGFGVDARDVDQVIHATLADPGDSGRAELAALTEAGALLADWDDEWILSERERLRSLRLEALETLAVDLTERGSMGQAVEAALAAIADEPFRESSHRLLIEAHLRKGNTAAAVATFTTLRDSLRSELGVEPSAELTSLVSPLLHASRN